MAKNYTADLGQEIITDWMGKGTAMDEPSLEIAIPDNSAAGVTYRLTIEQDIAVEAIQFKFDVSNESFSFGFYTPSGHAQLTAGSDLAIEVTSPSGTRSVLLSSKQALILPAISDTWHRGYILKDAAMLSNAFYGESAKGDWTIKLLDVAADSYQASDSGDNSEGFRIYLNNPEDSVLESVAVRIFGHAAN
jgi:hypothetical protein